MFICNVCGKGLTEEEGYVHAVTCRPPRGFSGEQLLRIEEPDKEEKPAEKPVEEKPVEEKPVEKKEEEGEKPAEKKEPVEEGE